MTDAAARSAYLGETVDLLWPAAGSGARRLVVLPHERTPRFLAPVRPRRAAVSAAIRYTAQQGPVDRLATAVLGVALLAGYARTRRGVVASGAARAAGGESVDALLSRVLGEPVVTTLAITAPRPNRKPVLQVFDRRGRTRAFVKIGVTPLARGLVDAEAHSLAVLAAADLRTMRIPRVLHHGQWRGCAVLVLDALQIGRPLPRAGEAVAYAPLVAAMREVGSVRDQQHSGADYLTALAVRAARAGPRWEALVADVARHRDAGALAGGAWHGDWTAWNCARHRGALLVWDWERFTRPAPAGFDLLHYVLNDAVAGRLDQLPRCAADLLNRAPDLLRPWGLSAGDAHTVALLYVLDLVLRYCADSTLPDLPGIRAQDWAPALLAAASTSGPRSASSQGPAG